MWARVCAATCLAGLLLVGSRSEYVQAQQKFRAIDQQQVKAGTKVPLTAAELNAYVAAELPKVAPPGVSRPSVKLIGNNTAQGTAHIDFVKLRTAQGKEPGWLLRTLLDGEHEVDVTASIRSGGGTAVVDLQRVSVGGIPIEGSALDFLIRNYLIPHYPEAKIGQPFEIHEHVDRIEVRPGMAYVVTR
jgi:hypothetical protein